MKIKVLVIAPYRGLVELTESLRNELQEFDITVMQSDMTEVLPMIGHMEKEGYDLIISRGGTADLLRQHVSLPIVEIQMSGYDILRVLTLVKDSPAKKEIIGFSSIINGFVSVSNIMNIHIPVTVISNEQEVELALARARDSGVKVVLGDHVTSSKAAEYGMQGILITSGKESVLEAFKQAKHIHHIAGTCRAGNEAYERLMDPLDEGLAVIDASGKLHYANHAFRRLFKLPPSGLTDRSLFDSSPFFKQMIEDMDRGMVYDDGIRLMAPGKRFTISAGKIPYGHQKAHYYIKAWEARMSGCEMTVSYGEEWLDAFPPLLAEGRNAAGEALYPEQGGFGFPLALYGEKGAGTRLFARAVCRGNHKRPIEWHISGLSDSSVEVISRFVRSSANHTVIIINGIEHADPVCQKLLYTAIAESPVKVIFVFEKEPKALADSGALDSHLYERLKHQTVFLPPLRERRHDLEGLIRSFIIHNNVRYGKQIVGVRPAVLSALASYDWPGNLMELQETIERFVKHTHGEYIAEDVLSLFAKEHEAAAGGTPAPEGRIINLNQSLEQIERDIIMTVLEEEDMNQSRAAKRLGINRSTLWRKIKQDGNSKIEV